jgi:hypothetical protein
MCEGFDKKIFYCIFLKNLYTRKSSSGSGLGSGFNSSLGPGDSDSVNSDLKYRFCDRLARSLRSTLVQLQEKC